MCLAENKALVRRFFDCLNKHEHVSALHELVARQCIVNGQPNSLCMLQDLILMMRTAFPNEQLTVTTLIAEGDWVAVRLTSQAIHGGPWSSPLGVIPPTQQACTQTGMQFFRIQDGLIVELWTEWNVVGQLQQLGALPAPDLVAA